MIEQIGILPAESDHSLLIRIIRKGDIEDIRIKKTLAFFAEKKEWRSLWSLADVLQREVSVLFDNEENIWVDIGTRGEVRMSPPTGAKIPFKMWIHTHPHDAYWSIIFGLLQSLSYLRKRHSLVLESRCLLLVQ